MPDAPADPPRSEVVFSLQDVRREFDDGHVLALRGVNLEIRAGEFVAIIGGSGSGKSTLLSLLGALDTPSSGSIRFQGKEMSEMPDLGEFRARHVGFVFQSFLLLPTLTALENVQVPMFELGWSRAERQRRAGELLQAVGMEHRLDHMPDKLSGGERQRVAIARSLANEPDILLADEPTGNLDSQNSVQIMDLLCRVQREKNTTMILVTHDPSIARLADRVITMKDGQVIADQPADRMAPSSAGSIS
ncbi:MAG: ABC transporter ATP-binding protein [Verrucomicrobiales bacterium]|nr:ABC transporter ATP-binding protein [Verrucomicrobiales bacterium]